MLKDMYKISLPVVLFTAVLIVLCSGVVIKNNCIDCICARNDCAGRLGKSCTDNACGPFYISEAYYNLSGKPGLNYKNCTQDMDCSKQCVFNFLTKYADACTYPRQPRCQDMSRMHWSGSTVGCRTMDMVLVEETIQLAFLPLAECCSALGDCD